jgi:hypothetical protein
MTRALLNQETAAVVDADETAIRMTTGRENPSNVRESWTSAMKDTDFFAPQGHFPLMTTFTWQRNKSEPTDYAKVTSLKELVAQLRETKKTRR